MKKRLLIRDDQSSVSYIFRTALRFEGLCSRQEATMAGNRGIIVKVGERGPAYEMVRITGYKQFPSANIVMWVMNGRALNKHAAREALRLVQRALRNTVWIRKWFRPPRGSHCSHGLPGKWNIRSRHLWTWKKNERLE